ncbi:gastrula zinc finger protein XlCGF52.1 [Bicyclus anynana]|uniref:Gastrula zinc finger protein XlCGF52.1 n=1 Tax=Bicyclus anynana TaxID=110368 RepID=A0A6J1NWS7_BICAN|nr:gastrula zinc finger protein XlCGF52.1 [Bicyclus anynana]
MDTSQNVQDFVFVPVKEEFYDDSLDEKKSFIEVDHTSADIKKEPQDSVSLSADCSSKCDVPLEHQTTGDSISVVSSVKAKKREDWYSCNYCRFETKDKSNLIEHNINALCSEHLYFCKLCHYRDYESSDLNEHMMTKHTDGTRCNGCLFIGVNKTEVAMHMSIHLGNKIYSCDVCDTKFALQIDLLIHMRKHISWRGFVCSDCSYTCFLECDLAKHERSHGKYKYCKLYDNESSGQRFLNTTKSMHSDNPYCCEVCGYSYTHPLILKMHMSFHAGEKPYCCTICSNSYVHKDAFFCHLRQHKLKNSGLRLKIPVLCTLCVYKGAKTKQQAHEDLSFACFVCGHRSATYDSLKLHLRKHVTERPYPCKLCKYKAKSPHKLKRHIKNMHLTCK